MIRNLFLDADDTLFDFQRSEKRALASALEQLDIVPTDAILARYSEINAAHWKLLERQEITRAELRTRRYEVLFGELGSNVSPERAASLYEAELAKGHYFIEGAEALVKSLAQDYRLYLASNGFARTQKGRLESSGLEPYFTDVFISQELGADKPDARFFEACFARIPQHRREESLIVGDRLTSDILGGKRAGITTVWFNPKGEPPQADILPDYEIRRLSELPPLLKRIGIE